MHDTAPGCVCRWLASADRDGKLRVSCLPKDAQSGAWEIQSYCLGHESSVTCASFLCIPDSDVETGLGDTWLLRGREVLVSGGLDGTVKFWDPESGECISTLAFRGIFPVMQRDHSAVEAVSTGPAAARSVGAASTKGSSRPAIIALATGRSGHLAVVEDDKSEVCTLQISQEEPGRPCRPGANKGEDLHIGDWGSGLIHCDPVLLPTRLAFATVPGTDDCGNDREALFGVGGPCRPGMKSVHLGCKDVSPSWDGTSAPQLCAWLCLSIFNLAAACACSCA
jgi:WD domain, G-beta repeat